jgi:glutamine---fructose-6-phosphate transaminase (isomerizing)
LAAARLVQESGAPLVAITNIIGSAIIRVADGVLYLQAGPESDVVSDQNLRHAHHCPLPARQYLGQFRGTVPLSGLQAILEAMLGVPRQMRDMLERADEAHGPIAATAAQLATCHSRVFIGRRGRTPDRT